MTVEAEFDDRMEEDEEAYDENEDEDFNPEKAAEDEEDSSSEDDEATASKGAKTSRKRKKDAITEELDSGDEATMKERKRRKRRKEEDGADEEDSGEDAGFIKTRSQRLAEKVERKQRRRAHAEDATIDVDEAWAELSSLPVGRTVTKLSSIVAKDGEADDAQEKENTPVIENSSDLVTIKRRINFAGKIEEVDEQVPRDSEAAQQYLAEHPEADPQNRMHDVDVHGLQRPMKRPSIFEPNPMSLVKGVPPDKLRPRAPNRVDVLMAAQRAQKKAERLSTVQKSALDWRGFVDHEGLNEELDAYRRSNRGYLEREAFLDRAAATREQAARDARLKL